MFCIVKGSIHPYLGTPIGNNLMLFQLEVLLDCFMVSSVFWYYNSSLIKSLVGNVKIRYFIVKSCNRENLEISVQQGIWATQRSNEAKLNEAFESIENVILIFSINRTRNFQVKWRFHFPYEYWMCIGNDSLKSYYLTMLCFSRVVQRWLLGLVATLVVEIGNLLMERHIMVGTSPYNGLRYTFLCTTVFNCSSWNIGP